MRVSLGAALLFSTVALSAFAAGDPKASGDEAQIVQMHQDFAKAWSSGKLDELLGCFTPDATRVGIAGDVQKGAAELKAAFDRLLNGPFKGARITVESGTLRMLGPGYAIWQAKMELLPPAAPPIRGYVVDVVKKVDGKWLIVETHPKIFPPPPPDRK